MLQILGSMANSIFNLMMILWFMLCRVVGVWVGRV